MLSENSNLEPPRKSLSSGSAFFAGLVLTAGHPPVRNRYEFHDVKTGVHTCIAVVIRFDHA
jgi:hypothetical protein